MAAPAGVAAAPIVDGGMAPSLTGSIFLTMAVLSWTFSGGLTLVADMTVGEKVRRTMEPLLMTPASRTGIVLGKVALSIAVSTITIGLWSLDSLAYVLWRASGFVHNNLISGLINIYDIGESSTNIYCYSLQMNTPSCE